MKVLVTGANGLLASNVVRVLNNRGIKVRAMVRPGADLRALAGTDFELFKGLITNITDVTEAARDCHCVIHAAAETAQHYRGIEPYEQVNVTGTLHALEAACKNQVERFIFVSTANTFGYGTKEHPGNEEAPARYPFILSGYALSKMKAQELVLDYARNGRINATVVNPTFMIGAYDTKPSSGKIITMIYGRKVILVPPGGKNFVHVADAATGICNAITKGKPGECYLLANENLTYAEFIAKVGKVCGKSYRMIKLSSGWLKLFGMAGELINLFTHRSALNRINASILCTGNYYSSMKAVKELDLPLTPIDVAIRDAIVWFGSNGYLTGKGYNIGKQITT